MALPHSHSGMSVKNLMSCPGPRAYAQWSVSMFTVSEHVWVQEDSVSFFFGSVWWNDGFHTENKWSSSTICWHWKAFPESPPPSLSARSIVLLIPLKYLQQHRTYLLSVDREVTKCLLFLLLVYYLMDTLQFANLSVFAFPQNKTHGEVLKERVKMRLTPQPVTLKTMQTFDIYSSATELCARYCLSG